MNVAGGIMSKDDCVQSGILGDINPNEDAAQDHTAHRATGGDDEDIQAMEGGSKHDRVHHSGSREVTEGVTGGLGTEVGGTRNYRQGTGATGGDIGNRPE
jgi:hypothetical protein